MTYALEGAILVAEVEDGRPVVGEVLGEGARRARGETRKIVVDVHGNIKPKVHV